MDYLLIPTELRELAQWVNYKLVERDGKNTKVPFCSLDGSRKASSVDKATWSTFDDAVRALCEHDGLGFVFWRGYTGIDMDNCFVNGVLADWARQIVDTFNSYTEISPSGNGLHIIVKGMIPAVKGARKGGIEMYSRARFFTMTGNIFEGRDTITENEKGIADLYWQLAGNPAQQKNPGTPETPINPVQNEQRADCKERLEALLQESAYFRNVWFHRNNLESQSDYDLQITIEAMDAGFSDGECVALVFHNRTLFGKNPSKAMRGDYQQSTLQKARELIAQRPRAPQLTVVESTPLFTPVQTVLATQTVQQWRIKHYLPQAGIVWLAGEWSTLKTFLALHISLHVATGCEWCGKPVKAGKVVYLAGEGNAGLAQRIRGLQIHSGIEFPPDSMVISERAVMVNEPKDGMRLSADLLANHAGLAVLVVDTKSANMHGSDSDPQTMNDYINTLRTIQTQHQCLVLVIDHVGHMSKDRPRGASQQMGAADAVYMVERVEGMGGRESPVIRLRTEKDPKDFTRPPELLFQGHQITLGADEDGDPITTLALSPVIDPVGLQEASQARQTIPEGWDKPLARQAVAVALQEAAGQARRLVAAGMPWREALLPWSAVVEGLGDWPAFAKLTKEGKRSALFRLKNDACEKWVFSKGESAEAFAKLGDVLGDGFEV